MKISGIIKIAKDERGQALIEFALIFTMLVILLFGIAEFGRGWYYANAMSNGARDGVRYASRQPKNTQFVTVQTYTFAQMTSAGVTMNNLFFNMSAYRNSSGAPVDVTTSFANLSTGDAVMVIVGYRMDVVTGQIIPSFFGTKPIARKATMRYEGN